MRAITNIVLIAALFVSAAITAHAQDAIADFYRGKTVILQIGSEPGGGYDVVGRVVAQHIGKYIPGKPNVIVQHVPGGGRHA